MPTADTLQLGNYTATPSPNVTPDQVSGAISAGWKPVNEPSVISTTQGNKVLQENISQHNADVSALNPPKPVTTDTSKPTISDATKQSVIAQGGKTADEANAVGITPDQLARDYNYDTNTGYYVPKNSENTINTQFENDKKLANDAFSSQMVGMDAATQNLVNSIFSIYNQRMDAQRDVNARQLASTNTENIRAGTSRYAPGVAQSIYTAEENAGLNRLNSLASELSGKVAEAQQNLTDKKYSAFIANRQEIQKLTSDRNQQIKDLHEAAVKKFNDDRTYKFDVQKFQETKDQNAFERAYKIEQAQFEENYKREQLRIEREKITAQYGTPGVASTIQGGGVQMTPKGTPDPIQQKNVLDQITAKYGPMTAQAIKGLVDYSRLPSDWSVRPAKGSGMSRADAVSLAQMLDPTYTEAGAPARQAYMKSLASGQIYNAVVSANKAIAHLNTFDKDVARLSNTSPISALNTFGRSTFGSSETQKTQNEAKMVSSGLGEEMAKFFKGTGVSDVKSVENFSKQLDVGANPAKRQGTVQGALDLFAGQVETMNQSYTNTMGKAPTGSLLQPETIAKLSEFKNRGYRVDIPGVYYTDPVAYTKDKPENAQKLSEVRKLHPELNPAQATQLAQYMQENGQ